MKSLECNKEGFNFSKNGRPLLKDICRRPWQRLYIGEDNKVRPECYCLKEIGDIEKQSLEQIWNSKNMQLYRKKLSNNCRDWCDNECRYR